MPDIPPIFRFLAAFALAVVLVACKESGPEKPTPSAASEIPLYAGKLALSPPELYKRVPADVSEVEFVFSARNEGPGPIRITRVDSGCACIEESVSKPLLQPGETAQITAVYETKNVNGLAEKTLGVLTDQPGVREVFLFIRLETEPIYRFAASQTFARGQPETRAVAFDVLRDKPLKILSVVSSRSEIKAELKTLAEGRKYEILLTPQTSAPLLGMVRIETDCEIEAHARPLIYVMVQ